MSWKHLVMPSHHPLSYCCPGAAFPSANTLEGSCPKTFDFVQSLAFLTAAFYLVLPPNACLKHPPTATLVASGSFSSPCLSSDCPHPLDAGLPNDKDCVLEPLFAMSSPMRTGISTGCTPSSIDIR